MPYAPEGNIKEASYVIVGEAPARKEMELGYPFAGLAGQVLDECLQAAGIPRKRCYLTNVWDFFIYKDKQKNIYIPGTDRCLWKGRSGLQESSAPGVERLNEELEPASANVFIPLGNPALEALTGHKGITKWRGSILPATLSNIKGRKCIPSIHPANALWGEYNNRYLIKFDLLRAKTEVKKPEIVRPKYNFNLFPTFTECISCLKSLRKVKCRVICDIEVALRQASRISFSLETDEMWAISIPLGDGGWSDKEETQLWIHLAAFLEDPNVPKVFQYGVFDIQFMLVQHNILVRGTLDDTYTAHSIMYPDFRAKLAFLTSLYTDQPFYKDMVKHGDIDKAEG